MLEDIFKKHKKVLFLCSSGKDSVATYHYLKPYHNKLTVGWINTGDLAPEVEKYMMDLAAKTPNFIVAKSNSKKWIEKNGYPSVLIPTHNTVLGQHVYGKQPNTIASSARCCQANIWAPIRNLVAHTKATAVLTGQKECDSAKDPRPNGTWIEGAQFFYPINDWTDDDVRSWLKKCGETDPRFDLEDSSVDCLHCTGYPHYTQRAQYIKDNHPVVFKEVQRRMRIISKESNDYLDSINNIAFGEIKQNEGYK